MATCFGLFLDFPQSKIITNANRPIIQLKLTKLILQPSPVFMCENLSHGCWSRLLKTLVTSSRISFIHQPVYGMHMNAYTARHALAYANDSRRHFFILICICLAFACDYVSAVSTCYVQLFRSIEIACLMIMLSDSTTVFLSIVFISAGGCIHLRVVTPTSMATPASRNVTIFEYEYYRSFNDVCWKSDLEAAPSEVTHGWDFEEIRRRQIYLAVE